MGDNKVTYHMVDQNDEYFPLSTEASRLMPNQKDLDDLLHDLPIMLQVHQLVNQLRLEHEVSI